MSEQAMNEQGDIIQHWVSVDCWCHAGIVQGPGIDPNPVEHDFCNGTGTYWRHVPSGTFAAWPGGPFRGREKLERV